MYHLVAEDKVELVYPFPEMQCQNSWFDQHMQFITNIATNCCSLNEHCKFSLPTNFKKSSQEYTFIPICSASLIWSLFAEVNATNAANMFWEIKFSTV